MRRSKGPIFTGRKKRWRDRDKNRKTQRDRNIQGGKEGENERSSESMRYEEKEGLSTIGEKIETGERIERKRH